MDWLTWRLGALGGGGCNLSHFNSGCTPPCPPFRHHHHPPTLRRSKAAEGAFLELYQRLYEAPDPAPALGAGLELASRAAQLEAEAIKMAQVGGWVGGCTARGAWIWAACC